MGDAGSGKSTLVKHLFLNSIEEGFNIPIIIESRNLNNYSEGLENYIRNIVLDNKIALNDTILNKLLEKGEFVFFLDGYDEIKSTSKQKVIESLNTFIDKYGNNRFLLTSRPYSNIDLLPMFHNYVISDLSEEEIKEFIFKQKIDDTLSEKIIESFTSQKAHYIKSFLTNPLLLSLYIVTFSHNSSIPEKRHIFYRRVLETLFKEHDTLTKIGFERELLTKFTQEQFEQVLEVFSLLSFFDNEYDFSIDYTHQTLNSIKTKYLNIDFNNNNLIDDLKSAINIWTEDSGKLSFAHRSIQEYLAASRIKNANNNKESVYRSIRNQQATARHADYFNVLSLCKEMDKYNFTKYYEIPSIEYFFSKINDTSDIEILRTVLENVAPSILLGFSKRKNIIALTLHFISPPSDFRSIDFSVFNLYQAVTRNMYTLLWSNNDLKNAIRNIIQERILDNKDPSVNKLRQIELVLKDEIGNNKFTEVLVKIKVLKRTKGALENLKKNLNLSYAFIEENDKFDNYLFE